MNWREAVQAMLEGKKVRVNAWIAGQFLYWPDDSWCPLDHKDEPFTTKDQKMIHVPSHEFEIYKEPKPKIKLGPEHVGKRVRLKNGRVTLILSWEKPDSEKHTIETMDSWHTEKGKSLSYDYLDIVEILY